MDQPQITRQQALEYFAAYADFEKENLSECIKVNSEEKLRGDIGAAEFEYLEKEKLLIVRGMVNEDIGNARNIKFKNLLIETFLKFNENAPFDMAGGKFEWDTSVFELQKDYPERINIRLDFTTSIHTKVFVKKVDALMDATYSFKVNEYQPLYDQIVDIVHPPKNKY